jgi:hypothetical protein
MLFLTHTNRQKALKYVFKIDQKYCRRSKFPTSKNDEKQKLMQNKNSNSHFPSFFCISCLLLDHYNDNESNDKSFVCALCLRRYSKLSCLKRHVRYECTKNPNRMSFKCPYCNHMSKRRDSLTQHILSLHSQSRKSNI